MIKNAAIGITLALFSFLLANGSQLTSPFAIYIALVTLALGCFLAYDQEKKANHINELRNQHLAALNKLSELETVNTQAIQNKQEEALNAYEKLLSEMHALKDSQEKLHLASSTEQKELMGNLLSTLTSNLATNNEALAKIVQDSLYNNTEIVRLYTEKQEQQNKKFDENNEDFNKAVASFNEAISSYKQLSQVQKADFDCVRDKIEVVIEKVTENHQKTTQAMMSSIAQVNTGFAEAMDKTCTRLNAVVNENRDAVNKASECLLGLFNQSLEELTQKVGVHHLQMCEAQTKAYNKALERQDETFENTTTKIEESIENLRQAVDDTNDKTRELTDTISKVLKELSHSMEENMTESTEKFELQLKNLRKEVSDAIVSLSDGLTSLAPKFVNYKEEKEIVTRLEALCKM